MDEAVVSKQDAHVEIKAKNRYLDTLSTDKNLDAAKNTLFRGGAELSTARQVEVSINGRQIMMEVDFAVSSSSIDLIILSGSDHDSGKMQVVTADYVGIPGRWEPRQVVYSYTLEYDLNTPGLVHFLL